MPTISVLIASALAGILSSMTGYIIVGRIFHKYQALTPATWRKTEGWLHYQISSAIRLAACLGIGALYAACETSLPHFAGGAIVHGVLFGALLWAVTVLPALLEMALFVNWDRRFVVGLLLDWFILAVMAGSFAALAAADV